MVTGLILSILQNNHNVALVVLFLLCFFFEFNDSIMYNVLYLTSTNVISRYVYMTSNVCKLQ